MRAALDRLSTTTIFTSIRAKQGRDTRLHRLALGRCRSIPKMEKPMALEISLSSLAYKGFVKERSTFKLQPDYFLITGG